MDNKTRRSIRNWAIFAIGDKKVERFYSLPFDDTGFGYDVFGSEREFMLLAFTLGTLLNRYYFSLDSRGCDNIPSKGRLIMASNRMGIQTLLSLMIWVDMINAHSPPRIVRSVVSNARAEHPFTGLTMQRIGRVSEHPRNMELVLAREEVLLLFPEKQRGKMKDMARGKKVSEMNHTFIGLCLKYQAPVVPVAVFTSEGRLPIFSGAKTFMDKLKLSRLPAQVTFSVMGFLSSLPLPFKLNLRYGEPIPFFEEYPVETIEHPNLIQQMSEVVREHVLGLMEQQ